MQGTLIIGDLGLYGVHSFSVSRVFATPLRHITAAVMILLHQSNEEIRKAWKSYLSNTLKVVLEYFEAGAERYLRDHHMM